MKRSFWIPAFVLAVAIIPDSSPAQSSGYAVVERGPDYTVLQRTTVENGTNCVHRITTVATGMNYTNTSGQLVESKEQIIVLPDGTAAGTQGRHRLYCPADIYSGVLTVITPDGRQLQGRPLCVMYDDGRSTVIIGVLSNSVGWLTASNQVTYRNCFSGINADLVVNYRRGGVECDLVFRDRPAAPRAYGLSDGDSTIQLVTEFFNTQDPEQIPAASDESYGLQDETLKFGKMTMGQGKSFAVQATNSGSSWISRSPSITSAPVFKNWLHFSGRTFLIEQVPLSYIAGDLNTLPADTNQLQSANSRLSPVKFASGKWSLPSAHEITSTTNQILLAARDLSEEPGVVMDYNILDTDQTGDFTFQSGQTYFIIGSGVYISGTTTIQGGTTIKFPEDGWYGLFCGTVVCATTAYNPAVFTSENDDSVGQALPWSSGSPTGGGDLYIMTDSELDHCVFAYAGTAVASWTGGGTYNDLQLVQCCYGIVAGGITVHNVLASGCQCVFDASPACDNCTFDSCAGICTGEGYYTNCIFSSVASLGFVWMDPPPDPPWYSFDGSHDAFYNSPQFGTNVLAFDGNYQSGPLGNYYLSSNSICIDAGSTTADRLGLYAYTTQTGQAIEGVTPVDLGYHYLALDGNDDPVSTLVEGVADYLSDANGDGLPDDWEMEYLGGLDHFASDQDPNGNTLLYYYKNGLDPNAIEFSVEAVNNYVNASTSALQLNITAGVPFYCAVLVDSANFDGAAWSAYTSANITVSLGTTEGWHDVWVGLKGCATNATVTWQWKRLKLDFTPPQLVITNPTNGIVNVPII